MLSIKKTLASSFATAAILANMVTPAFGATIEVSGNGVESESNVDASISQSTTVVQNNNAQITNTVNVNADTGDVDASRNTGGDVDVETGDATVDVAVTNTANTNSATVDCCAPSETNVLISDNGDNTRNRVDLDLSNDTQVHQNNDADIYNRVRADAITGDVDASSNTNGDVNIETGKATVLTTLKTFANVNSARVSGGGEGGSLSARILGNGVESRNTIDLDLDSSLVIVQNNDADVNNHVDADADTGDVDANRNTGGEVSIETGDALVDVMVDNMTNFNFADADCGCLLAEDWTLKILDNGDDSRNSIRLNLNEKSDALAVYQSNCDGGLWRTSFEWDWLRRDCGIDNRVDADAETGYIDAESNTGRSGGSSDPSVETGDADAFVTLENEGNVNVFGKGGLELPEVDLDFDLGGLWFWLLALG